MSKQPPPAPTASAVGPCPTVIQIVGRPGTGSLPRAIAPPDHPQETLEDEKSVVFRQCNDTVLKFSVNIKEQQDKFPTMYWLPKLHKRPYNARFIANSSACTTSELSKILTSCLTAIKIHVIRYCEKVYERSGKIKNSTKFLINSCV